MYNVYYIHTINLHINFDIPLPDRRISSWKFKNICIFAVLFFHSLFIWNWWTLCISPRSNSTQYTACTYHTSKVRMPSTFNYQGSAIKT